MGDDKVGCFVIIAMVALVLIGVLIGSQANLAEEHNTRELKQQAIDHGYAEYDRSTGEWQWVEPAESEDEDERD